MKFLTPYNIGMAITLVVLLAFIVLIWMMRTIPKPKMDSSILFTKGICHVIIGFFTPMTAGLAQWANSGEFPGVIVWIITGAFCIVGAASSLLSFLSGSYSDFVKGRANGGGSPGDNTAALAAKVGARDAFYAGLPAAQKPSPPPASLTPTPEPAKPAV